MAVVREGVASNGAKWRIHDDAYIGVSPEELERRRRAACKIAHGILVEAARKEKAHEQKQSAQA